MEIARSIKIKTENKYTIYVYRMKEVKWEPEMEKYASIVFWGVMWGLLSCSGNDSDGDKLVAMVVVVVLVLVGETNSLYYMCSI